MPRKQQGKTSTRTRRPVARPAAADQSDAAPGLPFPVVGIGASAGGIEALKLLLGALPADTGMAFVVIQHLHPSHASVLTEILARATAMPVSEVRDRAGIEPNRVYVIAPGSDLVVARGELHPFKRTEGRGQHRPIDSFLRSLAEDQGHQAIAVILSGSATDGTLGVEEVKAAGGITLAQDESAQQDSMPHSAAATGCVDFVLPPQAIAAELARIARHPYVAPPDETPALLLPQYSIAPVLDLLREATGVDFTHYKRNTLFRRVTRRTVLLKLQGVEEYLEFLKSHPAEVDALYQDVLINVTSFFRDPESYEALKQGVFPALAEGRARNDPVRIWVVGCSTGEEAYSLAIAFSEFLESSGRTLPLQLFATDLNGRSIERARAGLYSRSIAQDVSPERLRRYFVETEGGYRVRASIREACVFARHNVLAEPPFSRIDLLSCRNLLIYLGHEIQQRVIPILHYALRPQGRLWLGKSETIGSYHDLFDMTDPKHKIFRKKQGAQRLAHLATPVVRDFRPQRRPGDPTPAPVREAPQPGPDVQREADRLLLAKYAPAGVLVNSSLDVLQYRGDTGPYLAHAPGRASLNLLKMLREGLLNAVRNSLHRARQEGATVRSEGLHVRSNGGRREVNVEVIPVGSGAAGESCFMVLFEAARGGTAAREKARGRAAPVKAGARRSDPELSRLTQELAATREYLQSVIEQQEASNAELQSANEEVQSANEELQSINEELETSKEEIQSSNEELATINDELQQRNAELLQTNNDLLNLLASVRIAIVMLGPDLRIRRFTPAAEKMLNLIPADVGRPIRDLNLTISLPDFERHLEAVLASAASHDFEIRDKQGRWHSLRLRPYRTSDDRIDGVTVVLVDIDKVKRTDEMLHNQALLLAQVDQPILMWEPDGRIIYWNRAAAETYGHSGEQALQRTRYELLGTGSAPAVEKALKQQGWWAGDLEHTRRDGKRISVKSLVVLVHDNQGREMVIETNRLIAGDPRRPEPM